MRFALLRPPLPSRQVTTFGVVMLVFFLLGRVLFYGLYLDRADDPALGTLVDSFLIGARFDLSALALLLMPLTLVAHLPFVASRPRLCRGVLLPLFIALGLAATLAALGDCIYYGYAAKRITYEPIAMLNIGSAVLEFGFGEHPLLLPTMLVTILVAWTGAGWWLFRRSRPRDGDRDRPRARSAVWGLLLCGILVVCQRGALDGSQIGFGDAYFSNDVLVNHATLNPIYTFLMSSWEDRRLYDLMSEAEAVKTVRRELVGEGVAGEVFLSDEFPLLRRSEPGGPPASYNVVILLMESLSAEYLGAFGDEEGATPELDRLIEQSILFDRFFATGSRSSNGLLATLVSLPAQLGRPVTHSSLMLDNFRSLAWILREEGYHTTFIYGGVYDFTNAHGFLENAGFETIIGEPLAGGTRRRAWGYNDEDMFERLLHELENGAERPQFITFFTQNLHGGKVPKRFVKMRGGLRFPKSMEQHRYYNLLDYTDWCVGKFFEKARKRRFFENTIFLLLADHANHRNPHLYENRHIPFLIHAPWLLPPARYHTVGGQCDVLPTVLGLLGISTQHASFGQDLLAAARAGAEGQAYLTFGGSIGWVEGPWLVHDLLGRDGIRLYNFVEDPSTSSDLAEEHPRLAGELSHKGRAVLQLSRQLLFENRVCPAPEAPPTASER